MAKTTNQIDKTKLFVANTSFVKSMKDENPYSVKAPKELPNCAIVTLKQPGTGIDDHVYTVAAEAATSVVGKHVIVAPEIMVEQYRKTDGHIGKFRLEKDEVYSAYELNLHDRLELSETYFPAGVAANKYYDLGADGKLVEATQPTTTGAFKVVSIRTMAQGIIIKPTMDGVYNGAQLKMIKVEVVK